MTPRLERATIEGSPSSKVSPPGHWIQIINSTIKILILQCTVAETLVNWQTLTR